jgi:hypothetical protein
MDTAPLHLLAYQDGQLTPHPLPALNGPGSQCVARLRKLPGSNWMRVLLQAGEAVCLRAELEMDEGMPEVTLKLQHRQQGFDLECVEGTRARRLQEQPIGPTHETPINWLAPPQSLDLVLVIDATARVFLPDDMARLLVPSLLLAKPNRETHWAPLVDRLCEFVETLRRACADCRISVLAFGDQKMPDTLSAHDLRPAYKLHPARKELRALRAVDADTLKSRLLELPPSPGGDFVDALADALAAGNELLWRQDPGTRKLLLLSGESPGYSILHPLQKGDACIRAQDVDTQALRLHRKGVAILSLYHAQPDDYLGSLKKEQKPFLEAARMQYERLATLPQFAFETSSFEGGAAAESVLGLSGLLGYDGCCGEWVE